MKNQLRALLQATVKIMGKHLGRILAIHLVYQALGLILFAPLAGAIGRFFLGLSGKSVLSDMDILYFVISPPGIIALILFTALIIAILVFEQASMMAVCVAGLEDKEMKVLPALYATAAKSKHIFVFALNLILRVLVIALPFLAVAAVVAWALISDHDINYYLAEKPPIFILAAALITTSVLAMAGILVHRLTAWAFTLPLVLFTSTRPGRSFKASQVLTRGCKPILCIALGSWALASALAGTIIFGCIHFLGSSLLPLFLDSLTGLVLILGFILCIWTIANTVVAAFSSGMFVTLLAQAYIQAGGKIMPLKVTETRPPKKTRKASLAFLICLLIAGTVSALTAGYWLMNGIHTKDHIQIIAHRGAAGQAPENTMASFGRAILDQADWIEIDVQESSDGRVVVIHDSDFMKLARINKKVWDTDLAQIKTIDVGTWFAPEFAHERVPTLTEVLRKAKGKCRVLIELKYYGHDQHLEKRVAEAVEQTGMVEQIAVMSLDYRGIKKFKTLRPNWPVGLLTSKTLGSLSSLDVDFLAVNMATATPDLIRRIQATDKQVFVWTVNQELSMSRMISLGVDGLITDEPGLAAKIRQAHSELTTIEKLLIHFSMVLDIPMPKKTYRDQSP